MSAWDRVAGLVSMLVAGALGCATRGPADATRASSDTSECVEDGQCHDGRVCEAQACIRWWKMKGATPELSPAQVQALVDRGEVQILDVRTSAEFKGGHIDGAVSIPIGQLEDAADELPLDPNKPVIAVCLTAHRSIGAVRLLKRKGYDIVQLQGGMRAWRKADLPEKKGKPSH